MALLILQRQPLVPTEKAQDAGQNLVASANGQPANQTVGTSAQPTKSQSKISESLFDVNNPSVTQMKLALIARTGQELGVDKDDYASMDDFVAAMKNVVTNIKGQKGWEQVVSKIERDLGLDKLGVSLDDVINSARDPEKDDKVSEALKKQAGLTEENDKDTSDTLLMQQEEDATYASQPTNILPQV